MKHTNFYETIKEASMRLDHTVVLYDGEPYYVLCVTDHNPDGIFRVYLDPIRPDGRLTIQELTNTPEEAVPYTWSMPPGSAPSRGQKMDEYLTNNPKTRIIRKMANSPLFGKFRPFPLGMCNAGKDAYYIERTPNRATQQGLTDTMMVQQKLVLTPEPGGMRPAGGRYSPIPCTSNYFYDCVKGNYPDVKECLEALQDPDTTNTAVGFNRVMALVRGPLNTIFLAYKGEIVGMLPYNDLSCLRLSKNFSFVREVVQEVLPVREFKIV